MTKKDAQDKPKEFWIHNKGDYDDIYFETFVCRKIPSSLSEEQNYMYLENEHCIHTIEYSVYQELKQVIAYRDESICELRNTIKTERERAERAEAEIKIAVDSKIEQIRIDKIVMAEWEKENAELKDKLASAIARWNKAEDRIGYILGDSQELEQENAALRTRIEKLRDALKHYSDKTQFEDRGMGVTDESIAVEALTTDDVLAKENE